MKVHVEVKQKHIDAGIRSEPWECPIAQALRSATRKEWSVGRITACMGRRRTKLPNEAQCFIRAFDAGRKVKPFAFDIKLPKDGTQ
jgi:hypothetical protein